MTQTAHFHLTDTVICDSHPQSSVLGWQLQFRVLYHLDLNPADTGISVLGVFPAVMEEMYSMLSET